jgi:hypothetical protein
MYKRIDFNKLGGLATYQDTLDFLQASYRDSISAIAKAFGSKVIVSGVTDQGSNTYSDGWVVIDGELMPFDGGLKSPRVIVNEVSGTELFGDGSTQTVYFTRRATMGITGGFAFSDFIRVDTMSAISEGLKNLVIAHNNLQVQVNTYIPKPEWVDIKNKPNVSLAGHRHHWNEIDGIPTFITPIYVGRQHIGDFDGKSEEGWLINLNRNIGTDRYIVTGSLLSMRSNWSDDNDVIWSIKNKTSTSFWLLLKQLEGVQQDLWFEYVLFPY